MPTTFIVSDQDAREFRDTVRSLSNYKHGTIQTEIHNALQNHINLLKSKQNNKKREEV